MFPWVFGGKNGGFFFMQGRILVWFGESLCVQLSKHALKERFHGWQLCWKMLKTVCVATGPPPKRHPSLNVGVQVALFCIVPQIALAMHKGSVKKGRREEVQFNSRSLIVYCEFVTSALLCSKIDRKTSQAPLLECMFWWWMIGIIFGKVRGLLATPLSDT